MFVFSSKRRQAVGLLVSAAVCVCVALAASDIRAAGGDKKDGKGDLDLIQGDWKVSKISKGGDDIGEDILKDVKMSFKANKIVLNFMGMEINGTFTIDTAKKPKEIDVKFEGKEEQGYGIYKLEGDTLTICASEKKDERPKDFKGGGEIITIVLKKTKADKCEGETDETPAPQKGKADKDKIQGTWVFQEGVKGGQAAPPELLGKLKLTFKDDKLIIEMPDKNLDGTFKINDKAKPAEIDMTAENKTLLGIYEISGDTLKLCLNEKDDQRPKEFKSDAGSTAMNMVFKREKTEKKENQVAFLNPQGKTGQDKKTDKDLIQGLWEVESAIDDGTALPDEIRKIVKFQVTGDKIEVKIGDTAIKGTYTVDETKKPKQVDVKFDVGGMEGIYELTGDKCKMCLVDTDQKKARPTEFKSESGSGFKLVTLKRVVEKKDAKLPQQVSLPAQGKEKTDQDLLQGTWQVTSATVAGAKIPDTETAKVRLVVKGDKMIMSFDGNDKDATFKVDASKKPKALDLTPGDGQKVEGIYELTGDTLKICAKEGGPRPTEFKSDANAQGVALLEFKRVTEKKDPDKKGNVEEIAAPEFVVFVDEQDKKAVEQPPVKKDEQPAKKLTDAEKIVGTWKFLKARGDGEDAPSDFMASVRLEFGPDGKVKVLGTPNPDDNGTYKLDTAKGTLDLTTEKKKNDLIQGIYKFDGDKLVLCFSDKDNTGRPKEFTAEKGTKQIVFVLERATPLEVTIGGGGDAGRGAGANNVKQIILAFHNYHATFNHLPLHAIYSKDGKTPLLSWRVAILPYIEQEALYKQFKLDEPWDSAHNKKLIATMPPVYRVLGMGQKGEGLTYYVMFTGPDTPFDGNKKITFADFKDGTSNTAILFEAKDPVIWTKPDDLVLPKAKDKLPELGGLFKSGMNLGFADGSVRWVRKDIDPKTLRALITPSGGEVIDFNKLDAIPEPPAPAKQKVPDEPGQRQSINNLKQIGLAFHNHHDQFKAFPLHAIYSKDGKTPLLSWRVAILPYIDEAGLYNEFKLDEAWDSPHNKKLIARMPKQYEPLGLGKKGEGLTYYQVFTGPMSLFDGKIKMSLIKITDGTSNTALVFEAKDSVIWTKPDDLVFPKEGEKLPELGGLFKESMNILMCDGSVRTVRREIPAATLRAIITPRGGEVYNLDDLEAPPPAKESTKEKK